MGYGPWLAPFTKTCCDKLGGTDTNTIDKALQSLKDTGELASDNYYKIGTRLTGEQQYSGKGASAFLSELGADINAYRYVFDGLGHVASAAVTCSTTISSSSTTNDTKISQLSYYNSKVNQFVDTSMEFDIWIDTLVRDTLANITVGKVAPEDALSEVLASGSLALVSSYTTAKQKILSAAQEYANNYIEAQKSAYDPADPGSQHGAAYWIAYEGGDAEFRNFCTTTAQSIVDDVWKYLSSWADDLMHATDALGFTIQNSETYLSARDLYDFIYSDVTATQSTKKPITITPYKDSQGNIHLLITIGGTDTGQGLTADDGLLSALMTGADFDSQYKQDVENAIAQYMQEHPELRNSQVTFAGYSLGGMTAENIVDYDSDFLKKYGLTASNVITYGSPVMGAPVKGVDYHMYDATADPVPLLSYYENPTINGYGALLWPPLIPALLSAAATTIGVAEFSPWDFKLSTYIDPNGQYKGKITGITDVGTNPWALLDNHMHYYQSNQLNGSDTAIDINPTSLGTTEYFPMQSN